MPTLATLAFNKAELDHWRTNLQAAQTLCQQCARLSHVPYIVFYAMNEYHVTTAATTPWWLDPLFVCLP